MLGPLTVAGPRRICTGFRNVPPASELWGARYVSRSHFASVRPLVVLEFGTERDHVLRT